MPKSERYMHIPVKPRTYRELQELKKKLGASTWEELVRSLLEFYKQSQNFRAKQKLLKLLCNHYKESSASTIGWVRIVYKHFTNSEEFDTALQILPTLLKKSSSEQEAYVVNREKCRELEHQEV